MPGESIIKGFWGGGRKRDEDEAAAFGVVVWSLGTPDVGA